MGPRKELGQLTGASESDSRGEGTNISGTTPGGGRCENEWE